MPRKAAKAKSKKRRRKLDPPPLPDPLPIAVGTVCIQTVPWVGYYDAVYAFWQVRQWVWHPRQLAVDEEEPRWDLQALCHAVPYTAYPTELHWFRDSQLLPLPFVVRVPDHEEYARRWYKEFHDQGGAGNEFAASLTMVRPALEPFGPDRALFAEPMLAAGYDWKGWTRENYYRQLAKFLRAHKLPLSKDKEVWSRGWGGTEDVKLPGYNAPIPKSWPKKSGAKKKRKKVGKKKKAKSKAKSKATKKKSRKR